MAPFQGADRGSNPRQVTMAVKAITLTTWSRSHSEVASRLPVTEEIAGSNPAEIAYRIDVVERSGLQNHESGFDSCQSCICPVSEADKRSRL